MVFNMILATMKYKKSKKKILKLICLQKQQKQQKPLQFQQQKQQHKLLEKKNYLQHIIVSMRIGGEEQLQLQQLWTTIIEWNFLKLKLCLVIMVNILFLFFFENFFVAIAVRKIRWKIFFQKFHFSLFSSNRSFINNRRKYIRTEWNFICSWFDATRCYLPGRSILLIENFFNHLTFLG